MSNILIFELYNSFYGWGRLSLQHAVRTDDFQKFPFLERSIGISGIFLFMRFDPLQSFRMQLTHISLYGNSIEYQQLSQIDPFKANQSITTEITTFQQISLILIIFIMPIEVSPSVVKWLKQLKIISAEQIRPNGMYELTYNDQIYFQNGYLIAQLLKAVLRKSGHKGQGLLRIRKIAHISSNENWRILIDILKEIGYDEQIDPHNIQSFQVESILQFLNDKFGHAQTPVKKLKRTHIDLISFNTQRPLQSAQNLLEFLVLALAQAFEIEVKEAIGLLIENGKYLRQILYFGTNEGHQSVIKLYQNILKVLPTFNKLLSEEYGGQQKFLSLLGLGVLSECEDVCKLCCILLDSIDSDWPQEKGIDILIRSPHSQALDVLFRRLGPRMSTLLNQDLQKMFQGKIKIQFKTYTNLLRYFSHSLFGKQALSFLPISYYVTKAFDLFEPQQKIKYGLQERIAARLLLSTATKYFQKILGVNDRNQVLYCFDFTLTQSEQERYTTLCIIFELVSELLQKQKQFSFRLINVMWKYYVRGTINVKNFIISNLLSIFKAKTSSFPISLFLNLYQPSEILQANEFQLLLAISSIKDLSPANGQLLLKIATIYYYQQLCAGGMIQIIKNIIKNQSQLNWAKQVSQQILNKWPNLQIPPYHAVPVQSKKIKYRSVGLKKKEMIQFTQLNRYKNMLCALAQLPDKTFLISFAKSITQTMSKVQKSKVKQMQNTKLWFDKLLALIDHNLLQIKDPQRYVPSAGLQSISIMSDISMQNSMNQYQPSLGSAAEEQNNQFISQPKKEYSFFQQEKNQPQQVIPLLPFSQDIIEHNPMLSEEIYFQNYEHIFVKNIFQRYENLLQNLAYEYKSSLNLPHFFQTIGIKSYIEHRMLQILQLQKSLNLSQDQAIKKIYKILVQSAFYAFQFKSNRRISINCVESFMKLIADKNQKDKNQNKSTKIETKMQFDHQITTLLRRNNSSKQSYFTCFQILSQIFTNVGVPLVQPISKMVTKMGEITTQSQTNMLQQQKIEEGELKELEKLQKIIESEPSSVKKPDSKTATKFFKKKEMKYLDPEIDKSKMVTQRWAQVQKKVIMRRRELQGKAQGGKQ